MSTTTVIRRPAESINATKLRLQAGNSREAAVIVAVCRTLNRLGEGDVSTAWSFVGWITGGLHGNKFVATDLSDCRFSYTRLGAGRCRARFTATVTVRHFPKGTDRERPVVLAKRYVWTMNAAGAFKGRYEDALRLVAA